LVSNRQANELGNPSVVLTVLLDTHILIWSMVEPDRLSRSARLIIENSGNRILISAAVAWELAIKLKTGKIKPPSLVDRLHASLDRALFSELPITIEHATRAGLLPLHHRDPFDRLLVAQALTLGIPIISADTLLEKYGVERIE
jgi:PIN domain nuclease of toxin-antitoxin system